MPKSLVNPEMTPCAAVAPQRHVQPRAHFWCMASDLEHEHLRPQSRNRRAAWADLWQAVLVHREPCTSWGHHHVINRGKGAQWQSICLACA